MLSGLSFPRAGGEVLLFPWFIFPSETLWLRQREMRVSPLLPERFVYRELWLLNCNLLWEKLVRGPGEKLLFTPPVEKCNLERSLEAVRAATSPTVSLRE